MEWMKLEIKLVSANSLNEDVSRRRRKLYADMEVGSVRKRTPADKHRKGDATELNIGTKFIIRKSLIREEEKLLRITLYGKRWLLVKDQFVGEVRVPLREIDEATSKGGGGATLMGYPLKAKGASGDSVGELKFSCRLVEAALGEDDEELPVLGFCLGVDACFQLVTGFIFLC